VIYKGVGISINRLKLKIDLILIELLDFEAILVMNWLSRNIYFSLNIAFIIMGEPIPLDISVQ
jgi:hypothetical protein